MYMPSLFKTDEIELDFALLEEIFQTTYFSVCLSFFSFSSLVKLDGAFHPVYILNGKRKNTLFECP